MEAVAVAQLKAEFSNIPSKCEPMERQFGILQGKGKVEFHDDFDMTEDMLLSLCVVVQT